MKKILFLLLAAIMSLSQLLAQTVPITIGTGTSTSSAGPIPGLWGNHRSLQLFTAAELNQPSGCVIDSIALELGSVTAGVGGRDVRIYMKEVTETTLASTYVLNTLTDGAVLVYSTETEEICTANTWHTFALQTPFVYSGSSSLMLIFEGEGCAANGGCGVYIKYAATTSMAWTKCWDTTTPDMTSPIASSNTYRANTRFYVSEMPEDFCNTVTELAVSNILTDGADVSWTSDAVSFEYEYKLSTESWDSENVVSGTTTSTSVSLSELTPATTYNFRVKAICSDGLESYWMQLSFQTLCDVYQVPFEEGFENGFDFTFADGFIASPLCWANINPAADSYKWQTSTTNHSGSKSAYYYGSTYSATTSQDWLITPQVNLSGNERMNFYVKKVGASNPIGINIYAYDASSEDISSATDVASFVLIDSVPSAALTTTDWYEYELHLSDLGGTYRFALVPYAGAGGLYVDDFSITELPECIRPVMSSVASSEITANEATISWSDENNSQWIVYYKPISATEWASETASSTEVTLTDLIPGTLYNAYVVAVCGDEESDPTYTTSFITLCDVISDFPWFEGFENTWNSEDLMTGTITAPYCWLNINGGGSSYKWETISTSYEGSKAAYMSGYSSSSATLATYKNDDWLITPVLELTGNEVLSFYTKKSSTSYTPELRIYAYALTDGDMTSGADTANFVAIDSITNLTTSYAERELSLESLVGQYRLAFVRNKTIGHGSVFLDNVTVKAAPVCQRVQNLAVTNVTDTEITLSWDADENAASYKIYYKASGDADWTTVPVTESPYTIQNLSPATAYTINATAICSDETETGFILGPALSATTTCSPLMPPFVETFDTYPAGTAPTSCWKEAKGLLSNVIMPDSTVTIASSGWDAYSNYVFDEHAAIELWSTSKKDWLITPPINLGDGSIQYDLKFDLAYTYYSSAAPAMTTKNQKFAVLVSTDGGQTWDYENATIWDSTSQDQTNPKIWEISATGERVTVNLSSYTGNVVIGFYGEQKISGGDNRIHIDNVQVAEHIDCGDMNNMTVALNSATSALLNWEVPEDVTDGWTLAYGEGTSVNEETATMVNIPAGTELPYEISGLTPGTTYTFKVQYSCGGSWTQPVILYVPTEIATIPFACDFEEETERASWIIANSTHSNKWYIGTETDSTNNKLYVSNDNGATCSYSTSGVNVVYAYRYIQFDESAVGYKIDFDWQGGGESSFDFVKVGLFDAGFSLEPGSSLPGWVGSTSVQDGFTYLSDTMKYNESTTLRHAEIVVNGQYANGTIKKLVFAWRQDSGGGDSQGVAVDNISVTSLACFAPTDITLAEEGRQANSLTFDIADENGSEWEIQYRVYGTDGWTSAFFTSAAGAELSDLLSGTMYQVRVRTICGEDSTWFTSTKLYSTLCEAIAVTEETPYFEGFENGLFSGGNTLSTSGRSAPVCWFNIDGKHTSRYWGNTSVASNVYDGTKALYFNNSTSAAADTISDWLVTPVFDLAGTETFSFFAKLNSAGTYPLKVMYYSVDENEDMTSQADTSNFQLLREISLSETTYLPFDIPLNELTPGQYRLAFYASAPGLDVYIDNVSLSIISCQRPDGSSITFSEVAPNSATVSWEDAVNTAWTVYYKSSTESDYTSIPATTTTVALTGLTANSDYEVYITATCGESESEASNTAEFSTPCDYITEFPYEEGFETAWVTEGLSNKTAPSCWINIDGAGSSSYNWSRTTSTSSVRTGTGAAYSYGYPSSTLTSSSYINKDYLISPVIDVEGGARLSFYAKKGSTYYNGKIKIKYFDVATNGDMTSAADTADFVDLIEINDFTTTYSLYELDFPSLPSTYRIAFVRQDTAQGSVYIDDVRLSNVPTCTRPVPSSVVVSDVTTNSVTISWTDNDESHSAWNVYYREVGAEDYISVPATDVSVALTGLDASTQYEVYVTTDCGTEESEATNMVSFSTQMVEVSIPYSCDFDVAGNNGWALKNGTCTNKWHVGIPTGATSGALYISNDNGTTASYTIGSASTVVAEKLFETGTSDSLTISFDLTIGGETGANGTSVYDYLKVFWVPADTVYEASTSTTYYGNAGFSTNVIMSNATSASNYTVNLLTGTLTMSATIANQPNTLKKLVFVWRNDSSGGTQPGAIIDNLSIEETGGDTPAPCDAPTDLAASNVTETGATVTWNGTASSYEVRLAGGTAETVTTTSKTFTGLTAGTAYTVEVRAVCESSNSAWVSTSFTTQNESGITAPTVNTLAASNITHDGATLNGTITAGSEAITAQGFMYKASSAADWTTVAATGTNISATVNNLTAETAYEYKAFATTASGTVEGQIMSFTTLAVPVVVTPPTVETLAATEVTHEAATLNGTITAGSEAITAQGFKYKATTATDWTTVSATGTTLTATVNNLTAETAYEYKAFATTASGTVEGTVMNFTTAEVPVIVTPPTVTTLAATSVTHEAATLNGTIAAGSEAITAQGFMYKAITAADWTTVAAEGTAITATISGLTPETQYEYKAFATTESGTVEGNVVLFTTLANSGLNSAEGAVATMTVYPNPASERAIVAVSGVESGAKIVVSDMQGRIILTDTMAADTYELSVENLASGVYYIRVIDGASIHTQKLIVK